MKQKEVKQLGHADALQKRRLVAVVASVLLFIGVFSFVYWFIAFPLVWSAFPAQGWPHFWFNIYSGIAFLVWAIVVALALLLLWRKRGKIIPFRSEPSPITVSDVRADGPDYRTKLTLIQPGYSSDKASEELDIPDKSPSKDVSASPGSISKTLDDLSSQDSSSTHSLQTIVPNMRYENNRVDITRKTIPIKDNPKKISCTESESSVEAASNLLPSSKDDGKDSEKKPGVMLRKKPDLKLEIGKEEKDSGPVPLSPRELFFKDLLLKAEQGRARARSQEVRLVPGEKSDARKSMPASSSSGLPPPVLDNTAKIVAESPKSVQSVVASPKRHSSEEFFIAQVSPTVSKTSEVRLFISDHSDRSAKVPTIQWRLVSDGEETTSSQSHAGGRPTADDFIDHERRHGQPVKEHGDRTDDSVF